MFGVCSIIFDLFSVYTSYLLNNRATGVAFFWFVFGVVFTNIHFILGIFLGPEFLLFTAILFVALVYATNMLWALYTFIPFFFLQNLFISIYSPFIESKTLFTIFQGSSYLLCCILALMCLVSLHSNFSKLDQFTKKVCILIDIFLAACVFFFLLGALSVGFQSAAIYFRNATAAIFLLIIGINIGKSYQLNDIFPSLFITFLVFLLLGYFELFFSESFYDIFNTTDYYNFKFLDNYYFSNLLEFIEFSKISLFNLPLFKELDLKSVRLAGPNMHTISFAYIMAFFSVLSLIRKHYFLMFLALLLILVTGAKGPLILVVFSIVLLIFTQTIQNKSLAFNFILILLTSYSIFALIYGYLNKDYHVIGFLGGVKGFAMNPIGHGLGVGGNLSNSIEFHDWQDAQTYGVSYGLESAVGVLLYQIGCFTALLLAIYYKIYKKLWSYLHIQDKGHLLHTFSIILLLTNGIFQEEAYSPYALGLSSLLNGMLLSNFSKMKSG